MVIDAGRKRQEKYEWNGDVALICSYCKQYRSFLTVQELKEHIRNVHTYEAYRADISDRAGQVPPDMLY